MAFARQKTLSQFKGRQVFFPVGSLSSPARSLHHDMVCSLGDVITINVCGVETEKYGILLPWFRTTNFLCGLLVMYTRCKAQTA